MEFDFKITTWERVTVSEEDEQKVLDAIKEGKISSANDVYNFLDNGGENIDCNILDGTDEQMNPDDNGGCSTIEVIDSDGNTIFRNGNEV